MAALAVSPVSHPDYIGALLPLLREKDCRIRGFMQRPDMGQAKTLAVNLPQRLAKSHDAIEAMHLERANLFRRTGCTVMRVMEQQPAGEPSACGKKIRNHLGRMPFMHQCDIGLAQGAA